MLWITTLNSRNSLFLFHLLMSVVMRNEEVNALFALGFFTYEELAYCSDSDLFSLYRQYIMYAPEVVVEDSVVASATAPISL